MYVCLLICKKNLPPACFQIQDGGSCLRSWQPATRSLSGKCQEAARTAFRKQDGKVEDNSAQEKTGWFGRQYLVQERR
jgi:hypothetical protein